MIVLYALLLPTSILAVSVITYYFLRKEIMRYLSWVNEISSMNSRILKINFLKDVVKFFGSSPTSTSTQKLLDSIHSGRPISDSEAELLSINAMKDIEGLHSILEEMWNNSTDAVETGILLTLITNIILSFGVTVSVVQYTLIVISIYMANYTYIMMVGDLLAGAAMIFCLIIGLLAVMVALRVRDIRSKNALLVSGLEAMKKSGVKH
ncbi:MAG TPA: hypothetical protein VKU79_04815 [Thermoplasmataceae archaeon]|nr:hypothetical protein [Thermoplasmataceae archaeon]